jgi:hypothetical protein
MRRSWSTLGEEGRGTAGEVWLLNEPHVGTAKNGVVCTAEQLKYFRVFTARGRIMFTADIQAFRC